MFLMPHLTTNPSIIYAASAVSSWKNTRMVDQEELVWLKVTSALTYQV